jgi:hypothetical protein
LLPPLFLLLSRFVLGQFCRASASSSAVFVVRALPPRAAFESQVIACWREVLRDLRESLSGLRVEIRAAEELELAVLSWRMPDVGPSGLQSKKGYKSGFTRYGGFLAIWRLRCCEACWLPRGARSAVGMSKR